MQAPIDPEGVRRHQAEGGPPVPLPTTCVIRNPTSKKGMQLLFSSVYLLVTGRSHIDATLRITVAVRGWRVYGNDSRMNYKGC